MTKFEIQKMAVSVSNAASAVEISRSKAYELVRSGEWPHIHIGTAIRIPVESLNAWLEAQGRVA